MNEGRIVKCPHCGNLYRVHPFQFGDQSACPGCRREADRNTRPEGTTWVS